MVFRSVYANSVKRLPCSRELPCQWLCDKMSYLAARVTIPSNMPTLPTVLNTLLHCLPQKGAIPQDGSTLSKGAQRRERGREKERANSPSRTGSHANGTPKRRSFPAERRSHTGVFSSSLWPGWGLIS